MQVHFQTTEIDEHELHSQPDLYATLVEMKLHDLVAKRFLLLRALQLNDDLRSQGHLSTLYLAPLALPPPLL